MEEIQKKKELEKAKIEAEIQQKREQIELEQALAEAKVAEES